MTCRRAVSGATVHGARCTCNAGPAIDFDPLPECLPLAYPSGTVFRTRDDAQPYETYFMAVSEAELLHNGTSYLGTFVSWTADDQAKGRAPWPHPGVSIGRLMITGVHVPEYVRQFVKEAP